MKISSKLSQILFFAAGVGGVLIPRLAWYLQDPTPVWGGDTGTYVNFSFRNLLNLNFSHRTPVYPIIIRLCKILFRDRYLDAVVLLQIAIAIFSVWLFYLTIKRITNRSIISLLIAVAYGNAMGIMRWDKYILTESFSISLSMTWLYLTVRYIYKPKSVLALSIVVLTFIMTFLRPAFLVWNICVLAFFLLRFYIKREERRFLGPAIRASCAVFLCIGAYCTAYQSQNGVFNVTNLAPRHLMSDLLISGLYKSNPDKEMVNEIESIYLLNKSEGIYSITWKVWEVFGENTYDRNVNLYRFDKECIRHDIKGFIKYTCKKILVNSRWKFYGGWENIHYRWPTIEWILWPAKNIFNFMYGVHLWAIGGIEALITLAFILKNKKIPWIHFGISIMLLLNLFFTYIATYDEFIRCSVFVFPFAYCSIALLVNKLYSSISPLLTKRITEPVNRNTK